MVETQSVSNQFENNVGGKPVVVSVRFQPSGKPYHFVSLLQEPLASDYWVAVETVYGTQVGQIVELNVRLDEPGKIKELRPVLRIASGLDMARHQVMQQRGERMVAIAEEELRQLNVPEVKAVYAEITLEGDNALVFCTGNISNQHRNTLRRRLSSRMNCRVDLRPIGPRDHAKLLDGYGVCGERRCCARFLTEFQAVSIRMAKDQAISMAPTDITGICGRLRCCLAYEHQVYMEIGQDFPKRKSRVQTSQGIARVLDWDVLKNEIIVEIPPDGPRSERVRYRFGVDEVQVLGGAESQGRDEVEEDEVVEA